MVQETRTHHRKQWIFSHAFGKIRRSSKAASSHKFIIICIAFVSNIRHTNKFALNKWKSKWSYLVLIFGSGEWKVSELNLLIGLKLLIKHPTLMVMHYIFVIVPFHTSFSFWCGNTTFSRSLLKIKVFRDKVNKFSHYHKQIIFNSSYFSLKLF